MCYYPLACPSELIILSELIIVSLLSRRTEIDEVRNPAPKKIIVKIESGFAFVKPLNSFKMILREGSAGTFVEYR